MSKQKNSKYLEKTELTDFSTLHDKYAVAGELLRNSETVLDVGCGDGSFCVMLKERFNVGSVYGVDVSEDSLALANRRGVQAYLVNMEKDQLPFEREFFDGIFCGEIIEHLQDPDHLLDEVYRVLKFNGKFVLTTPNLASWYNRLSLLFGYQPFFADASRKHAVGHLFRFGPSGHVRAFTLRAVKELAAIHGFRILSTIGFGINTQLGYGRRWKSLVSIANKVFAFPSLCSDIMLVLTK